MSRLSIVEIKDPNEFQQVIQVDQKDKLYIYIDDIFEPIDNIYSKVIETYEKYKCTLIFTDIQTHYQGNVSNQYFNDIENVNDKRVVYSPIITRFIPKKLNVYPDLVYHSFSFLQQIRKDVFPWHIPTLGFKATIGPQQFQQLSKDCQWVLQQEI